MGILDTLSQWLSPNPMHYSRAGSPLVSAQGQEFFRFLDNSQPINTQLVATTQEDNFLGFMNERVYMSGIDSKSLQTVAYDPTYKGQLPLGEQPTVDKPDPWKIRGNY